MIDLEKVSIVEWFDPETKDVETHVIFSAGSSDAITEKFSKDHPYTLFTALRYLQKRLDEDEKRKNYEG